MICILTGGSSPSPLLTRTTCCSRICWCSLGLMVTDVGLMMAALLLSSAKSRFLVADFRSASLRISVLIAVRSLAGDRLKLYESGLWGEWGLKLTKSLGVVFKGRM